MKVDNGQVAGTSARNGVEYKLAKEHSKGAVVMAKEDSRSAAAMSKDDLRRAVARTKDNFEKSCCHGR